MEVQLIILQFNCCLNYHCNNLNHDFVHAKVVRAAIAFVAGGKGAADGNES